MTKPKIKYLLIALCLIPIIITCVSCGRQTDDTSKPVTEESKTNPPPLNNEEEKPSEADFINKELLSFIGQPLSVLEEDFGENYYFHGVGLAADALNYYDPYICFYCSPIISGKDGSYPDPLSTDRAVIKNIIMQSDYDLLSNTFTGQDSLRRFFLTEEQITYDLLTRELNQSPELEHDPNGGYTAVKEFSVETKWMAVDGGTYRAVYVINDFNITISFIKINAGYVALSINIEPQGADDSIALSEPIPLTGYIVIEGNKLILDAVEVIMTEDEERIAELGLNPVRDLPNGYYINRIGKEKSVYILTDETVYTFVDFNLLFVEDADGDRLYSTTEKEEFIQHLSASYTDSPPAQNVPFFIQVNNEGNVISIEENLLFTI